MNPGRNIWAPVVLALLISLAAGCRQGSDGSDAAETVTKAIAVLHPLGDSNVTGMVIFARAEGRIRIQAVIEGLEPGQHGFHIHKYGDCSSPDGKSAGGHFNPEGAPHGGPSSEKRHVGDLGNITADASGEVELGLVDSQLELGGPHSIIGRAVVVHAVSDDLTSQPSGAAGARIACGVIGIAAN